MKFSWFFLWFVGVAVLTSCQTHTLPTATASAPIKLFLNPKTLTLRNPGTGDLFTLHLGEELPSDSQGITEVTPNIKKATRSATSSYYEPTDKDGGGDSTAESIYTRAMGATYLARWSTIQYQPVSGLLLITEDVQDGAGNKRYIL